MMELKDKVLKVREMLFISQETLAKEIRGTFATVNRWENGHSLQDGVDNSFYALDYISATDLDFGLFIDSVPRIRSNSGQ